MLAEKININKVSPRIIKLIASALAKGQVLVLPTDTIYGLSCLADNIKAIKKIQKIKGRDSNKPLSILVSDLKMLKKYVHVSAEQEAVLNKVWSQKTKPTTVILKHRSKLPKILTAKSSGLAARLPKLNFLIKILEELNCPLVSTSLNLSGEAIISNPQEINKYFLSATTQPDLVIDAGPCRRKKASKIIDLREEASLIVLRK